MSETPEKRRARQTTPEFRKKRNARLAKRRVEVLAHYSGGTPRCACCNERHVEFLSIDHVNGGGNKHRKEQKISGGGAIYYWLIRNKFPEGFQVLCHNCNLARGFYGYCPHLTIAIAPDTTEIAPNTSCSPAPVP